LIYAPLNDRDVLSNVNNSTGDEESTDERFIQEKRLFDIFWTWKQNPKAALEKAKVLI
jgi:hypothetical protein